MGHDRHDKPYDDTDIEVVSTVAVLLDSMTRVIEAAQDGGIDPSWLFNAARSMALFMRPGYEDHERKVMCYLVEYGKATASELCFACSLKPTEVSLALTSLTAFGRVYKVNDHYCPF